MKILRTSEHELEIKSNGIINLVFGALLLIGGIAALFAPLYTSAEWWVSVIGVAVSAFGILIALTARNTRTIPRKAGTCEVIEKRLIGGKVQQMTFESSNVDHVKLESHIETSRTSSSSDGQNGQMQRQRVSTLFLVLNDATEITLGDERKNSNGGLSLNGLSLASVSKAPLTKEGQEIADFFGVPFKTGIQDASIQDMIGAAKTVMSNLGTVPPATTATPQSPTSQTTTVTPPSNNTDTTPQA